MAMPVLPQNIRADLILARSNAMKRLTSSLPNEQYGVVQFTENLIFRTAMKEADGDHSMILNSYNLAVQNDVYVKDALSTAKEASTEYDQLRPTPTRTERSASRGARKRPSRPHAPSVDSTTPDWGEVVEPSVRLVLGAVTLLVTYDLGNKLLNLLTIYMAVVGPH